MRQNPHVRICGGPGSATTLVYPTAKHGGRGRRGWRKLHLGVDQSGVIRVHTLTEATGDDATTALDLLTAVEGPLVRITADAAYDTVAVYQTATARGATVVIPPARTANVSGHGPRSPARDRTITLVQQLGRRRWKKRRCCVNRNWHRALPRVGSSPIDRERLWSTKLGHSIEHVARTHRFDSLRCASPTSKSIAENRLVPEERVLDAGLSMIADLVRCV